MNGMDSGLQFEKVMSSLFFFLRKIEKMVALSSDFIASFDKLFYDLWVLLGWLYVICGFFWVSELRLLRVGPWCTRKRKSGFDAGACALLCSVLGDAGARHVTRPHIMVAKGPSPRNNSSLT